MTAISFHSIKAKDDLAPLENLAKAIWIEHYIPIIGSAQVEYMLKKFQSIDAMIQQMESDGYLYFTIHQNGKLIGYYALQQQQNTLFLSKLYLNASCRGKGFARLALEQIESFANQHCLTRIRLTVNKYNENSIKAYLKLGFNIVEEAVFDIGEGYIMDDYVMEKTLV